MASNASNTLTPVKKSRAPALPRERSTGSSEAGTSVSLSPRQKNTEAPAQGGAPLPHHTNEPVLSGDGKSPMPSKETGARTRRHSSAMQAPSDGEAKQNLSPPTSPRRPPSPRGGETAGRFAPPPPPRSAKPGANAQHAAPAQTALLTSPTRSKGPNRRRATTAMPATPKQAATTKPATPARPVGGVALPVPDFGSTSLKSPRAKPVSTSEAAAKRAEESGKTERGTEAALSASARLAASVRKMLNEHGAKLDELGILAPMQALEKAFLVLQHRDLDLGQATVAAANMLSVVDQFRIAQSSSGIVPLLESFGQEAPLLVIVAELCCTALATHFQKQATLLGQLKLN